MRERLLNTYLHTLRAHEAPRTLLLSANELFFLHRLVLTYSDVITHQAAREALDALPPPPAAKLPKEADIELSLSLVPSVALDFEEETTNANVGRERGDSTVRAAVATAGGVSSAARSSHVGEGDLGRTVSMSMAGASRHRRRQSTAVQSRTSMAAGGGVANAPAQSAAPAKLALRALLAKLPLQPPLALPPVSAEIAPDISDHLASASIGADPAATWRAVHTEMGTRATRVGAAEQLRKLDTDLRVHWARVGRPQTEAPWAVVKEALGDARAVTYLKRQASTYESSVARLRAAATQLEEEVALYSRTLEQVRPAPLEGKANTPLKYVCTGEKLQKKGLIGSGAPVVEDVDPKLVARYWPKASFTFELQPHGELSMRADIKGRTVWEGQLRIDDCLRRRADGVPAIDVSGVEVSLPELIDLLDKKLFMSKKASR